MDSEALYSILLRERIELDVRKYAAAAAKAAGSTVLEMKMRMKKGRGVLLCDVTRHTADDVASLLNADGVACDIVEQSRLPAFPAPKKAVYVARDETMFTYRRSSAVTTEAAAWSSLAAVAFGVIMSDSYVGFMGGVKFQHLPSMSAIDDPEVREDVRARVLAKAGAAGRFQRMEIQNRDNPFEELERKRGGKVCVHVDCVSGDLHEWIRVNMAEFSYEISPGKPKYGGSWGIRYLVDDVRKKVPTDALTPATKEFVGDGDANHLLYADVEEFQQETEWFLMRKAMENRFPPGTGSEPVTEIVL